MFMNNLFLSKQDWWEFFRTQSTSPWTCVIVLFCIFYNWPWILICNPDEFRLPERIHLWCHKSLVQFLKTSKMISLSIPDTDVHIKPTPPDLVWIVPLLMMSRVILRVPNGQINSSLQKHLFVVVVEE